MSQQGAELGSGVPASLVGEELRLGLVDHELGRALDQQLLAGEVVLDQAD